MLQQLFLHLCQLCKVLPSAEDMCNTPPWSMKQNQGTLNARCHGSSVAVEQRQRRVPSPFKCRCEQLATWHTMWGMFSMHVMYSVSVACRTRALMTAPC